MSNPSHVKRPVEADSPLPAEVAVRTDTWLNRARNYPVFSRTWFYYRSLAWSVPVGIIALFSCIVAYLSGVSLPDIVAKAIPATLTFTMLHLLGPGLAVLIRQRHFSSRKESVLIVLALLAGALISWGALYGSKYSVKLAVYGDPHHVSKKAIDDKAKKAAAAAHSEPQASSASQPDSAEDKVAPEMEKVSEQAIEGLANAFVVIGLLYLAGGFDLWLYFRQKKRLKEVEHQRELQRAQEARREAELRLSVLVAQVEPHFLFNTLAGVRSAINTEPARAVSIVDHLVDYLRATIPQMRDDGASVQGRLKKQFDAARAYLSLMQARIPRLSFSVYSEVEDAALPPLLLISLVENAIKHGVEPKIGPAHIAITAGRIEQHEQSYLQIRVADDGVGFGGSSSGSGIGLTNIHQRLHSMYGTAASLELKARAEGGVLAVITLPYEP
ncbi:sensor histidine kinase [Undibacterium rugosum]|uniref:Histidine kinase n=1 Tax=Undibacterium rugosum TaxID=2762291 RepID=A0A923KXZ7_9BURK|nr:histidine kinase [Undibacterium rugosum]MBC3933890.1 histidine kinase [Undibacterium rugosum]MBR7777602.1 histidine kinase [Undibacterium rugosum]